MTEIATPPAARAVPFGEQLRRLRTEIDRDLLAFLAGKREEALATAPEAVALVDRLEALVASGGKRLRPALVQVSYLGCGGTDPASVRPLALATELLHAYLLIHDDIMDHAATRRGRPTAHAFFAGEHGRSGLRGDAADFGTAAAILAGDLGASYAQELFATTAVASAHGERLQRCFAAMCQEVVLGQYVEVLAGVRQAPGEAELLQVLRLKSGRYSVERPLELGAILAGAPPPLLAGLAVFGRSLGEAFQLRDDVLGLFGDEATVGKPVGGDLVEGKYTFLLFHAMARASDEERRFLDGVRGNAGAGPAAVARALRLVEATGARAAVEAMIHERVAAARRALAELPLSAAGSEFLAGLTTYLEERAE